MHAIFPDHRSRGSGDIRADTQTDLRIYYIDDVSKLVPIDLKTFFKTEK